MCLTILMLDAMTLNMKRNAEMGMAHDNNYSKYAGYKPYANYAPYSAAVEEATAKMDMGMLTSVSIY
jgi:hypothetical protein